MPERRAVPTVEWNATRPKGEKMPKFPIAAMLAACLAAFLVIEET